MKKIALFVLLSVIYSDSKFISVLFDLLDDNKVTPAVRAQLLQTISIQNLNEKIKDSFLKRIQVEIEKDVRYYAVVRRGAYRAVGNLDNLDSWNWLMNQFNVEEFGECKDIMISSLASKFFSSLVFTNF